MAGTRDRIIVATNELFRRYGYNGTTLTQISEASAATIGSIYHFFPGGKEALAVAVVETTGAVYRELFESIVAEADDAAAAYVDFFNGAAAVLEESDFIDPCPIGTIAREVANTSEPLRPRPSPPSTHGSPPRMPISPPRESRTTSPANSPLSSCRPSRARSCCAGRSEQPRLSLPRVATSPHSSRTPSPSEVS